MRRLLATLALALPAFAPPAVAQSFQITEIYSNASGTVQYIELRALAGGQQAVQGRSITSNDGTNANVFVLPGNLPGDTSGRRMLLGTAGVKGAFNVTPDFQIPDAFVHVAAGTIQWADGIDTWARPVMPTDGQALFRNGSTGTPSPQNFAVPPAVSYQALWWASPAGSESGWGVNIAHQGDTL